MGYLGYDSDWEVRGREYFDKLAMRSLFQDFSKTSNLDDESIRSFKMHDIIHDFAQFLRKNVGSRMRETNCQACSPLLVSQVEKYRSLFLTRELYDQHLCDGLTSVRLLSLRRCGLGGIPEEIEKLIHLRWLDLSWNNFIAEDDLKSICKLYSLQFLLVKRCELKEIPREIGNLIQLKELDLSYNTLIEELPESMCNLRELESLNIKACVGLVRLPQGIHRLVNLKHLYNKRNDSLKQYPQGLAQLTSLVTLKEFHNQDGSKLGWLKNLNRLSDSLELTIVLSSGDDSMAVVEDAREAELRNKTRILNLQIFFPESTMGGEEVVKEASARKDILDALEPHPNLQHLEIIGFSGLQLPQWIVSPLNPLKYIKLTDCEYLSTLPPLGKLPLLEVLVIGNIPELEFVGREFLGIITKSSSVGTTVIGGFPKLEELKFGECSKWKEWEDITAEEDFVDVKLMPCLEVLIIKRCSGLTELPQRLMRKVSSSSLKELDIHGSKLVDALDSHLPEWIMSPLNQLRIINLCSSEFLSSLPPLGKLPLLEVLLFSGLFGLEFVGRDFLGITTTTTSIIGGFPKLKELQFEDCSKWKEWEDITAKEEEEDEEDCDGVSLIMPCLTRLTILNCKALTELPHRLLRKVSSSLKVLRISH